jgi:hypothetical protein
MVYFSALQRGATYGASFLMSSAKSVGRTTATVTTGVAKAAMFVTIPNSKAVALGVGATTWYAKSTAAAYAPQLISAGCIKAAVYLTGNATVGSVLAKTVLIPAIVPTATPIVVGAIGVGAYMASTGIGNAINHFATKKDIASSKANEKELSMDDFEMVEKSEEEASEPSSSTEEAPSAEQSSSSQEPTA